MTLTEPTRATREFLRLRDLRVSQLSQALRKQGVRLPKSRHSPAFEAGARASLSVSGKE